MRNCNASCSRRFYLLVAGVYTLVIAWLWVAAHGGGSVSIVVCPTKLLWHVPCPSCGVTRATLLMLSGRVTDALCLNPNVVWSTLFVGLTPLLLLTDLIGRHTYTLRVACFIDQWLTRKAVLLPLLAAEALIGVHNIWIGV